MQRASESDWRRLDSAAVELSRRDANNDADASNVNAHERGYRLANARIIILRQSFPLDSDCSPVVRCRCACR